jgi:hypothetical protein
MSKVKVLVFALFALFAFSSFAASEALALETVWLDGGVKPTEWLLVDSEGELLLEDQAPTIGGKVDVLCSGLNEGWIGSDASGNNPKWDEVTKITSLTGANRIPCTLQVNGGCNSAAFAEPINLPWLTELILVGTAFLDLVLSTNANEIGWLVECLDIIGGLHDDTCTIPGTAAKPGETEVDNTTEKDVKILFAEALQAEKAHCTLAAAGSHTGVVEGEVLVLLASGEELSVSEA